MLDFFGTRWDDVTVQTVEVFLADAGDEGLTWEAKGREEPHRDTVRKAACGFANASGGFLIIGAEREPAGTWTLNGVAFRSAEPGTWLSSLLSEGGLSPRPPFDVKVFERDDGRAAAVLAVDRVVAPPCVTASGVVYQRVTGQTLPVTHQLVLAELFARGRAAHQQAEALALRAADRALQEPRPRLPDAAQFSVALCPTHGAPDKVSTIFSFSFRDVVHDLAYSRLQVSRQVRYEMQVEQAHDCLRVFPGSHEMASAWTLAVYWDGSVSVVFATGSEELYVDELIALVLKAWKVLVGAARAAGGDGESHLVVLVRGEHPAVAGHRGGHPTQPVQRWTDLGEPTEDELGSLQRELQRGFGQEVWEPEPPATDG